MATGILRSRWEGDDRRGPATVLIAGDVADANELLTRVLTSHGYRTVAVQSVDAGVVRAVETLPRVALIDLSTRGMGSSLQLLDAIRSHEDERVRRTRVIVVAGSRANRNFAFQSGADGFLLRPFHANDLLELIEQVLAVAEDDLPVLRRQMIDAGA